MTTSHVDISIADLMDVIDQYANAVTAHANGAKPATFERMTDLRASIERMLTDEKAARRSLEALGDATNHNVRHDSQRCEHGVSWLLVCRRCTPKS